MEPALRMSPAQGRLLVVDDEENILKSLRRVLRTQDWEIRTALDGERGLKILEQFTPEVVISDFRLPGMNGADFLQHVKKRTPLAQRIMLTQQLRQPMTTTQHNQIVGELNVLNDQISMIHQQVNDPEMAKKVAAAAVAETVKRNWQGMCIAVVGPSGDLVYFEKQDNCQFASITISQHKARTSARYRRPTVFWRSIRLPRRLTPTPTRK